MKKKKAHFFAVAIAGLLVFGTFLPTAPTHPQMDYQVVSSGDDDDDDDDGYFIFDTKWIFFKLAATDAGDQQTANEVLSRYGQ